MSEALIKVNQLKKHYELAGGGFIHKQKKLLHALDDVSFSVRKGEIFGVVGESGCGKSTLGRCLLRLIDITDGSIQFDGRNITKLDRAQLKPLRRYMQMIFQNPFSSFDPRFKLGASLVEVGRVHSMEQGAIEAKLKELMSYINLPESILSRRPGELSGGQLQRLAIARALILEPLFIVADEPVSALDVSVQAQILNLLVDLRKKLNMTMLFISHEMTVVEHLCDAVAVMYLGRVVEMAPTRTLFGSILHPYTQALFSSIPKADPDDRIGRIMLKGEIPNAIDIPKGCRFAARCPRCAQRCLEQEPELRDMGDGHYAACHLL